MNHLILILDTENTHVDVIVEALKVEYRYNTVAKNEYQIYVSRENSIQTLVKLISKYEKFVHVLKDKYIEICEGYVTIILKINLT